MCDQPVPLWILEDPCDSWFWDTLRNPDSCGAASHGLIPFQFLYFLGLHAENEHDFRLEMLTAEIWHRIARKCAGTGGRWSVSGQKHVHPKASASRSDCCSSRDHTRPHRLSFALSAVLTMNARRFLRTHSLSAMGEHSLKRVKGYCFGSC